MKNKAVFLNLLFPVKQLIIILISLLIVELFVMFAQAHWVLELSIFIVLQYLTLILVRHSYQLKKIQQTQYTPLIKFLALSFLGFFSLIVVWILFLETTNTLLFSPINILNIISLFFLILASFFVQEKPLFQIEKLFDFDVFLFLNNLKKTISLEYQKAFLWIFILSLLICSYFIYSFILFPDDYASLKMSLEEAYDVDHNGRWFKSFFYNHILQGEFRFLNSMSLIVTYCFVTLSGLLLACIFEVKRLSTLILLGLVFNLNPFLNYLFSYSSEIWHTGLAIFFSVLACYLIIKKTRQYFLIAMVLFTLSCSLYQINFIFSVLIIALWFLYQLIHIRQTSSLIKLIIQNCGYFLVVLISFVIAHYLSKVYFSILDYQVGGRLTQSFFSFDLLIFRFNSIFSAFIQLEKITFIPPLLLVIFIFMVLFVFLYAYFLYVQKYFNRIKPTHQKLILVMVNIILLPILFNLPELIGVKIPQIIYLHYFTIGLYLVLAFYALYQFIHLSHRNAITLRLSIIKTVLLSLVLLAIPILIFSPKLIGLSLPLQALYPCILVLFFLMAVRNYSKHQE